MTTYLKVKLQSDLAKLPCRATPGSVGYDLFAADNCFILSGDHSCIQTGISVAIPPGHYGRIASRSSLSLRHGIEVGAGVIDTDYRGEILVVLYNHGFENYTIKKGDKIAQLILEKIITPEVVQVDELDDTVRGFGGFGSTDKVSENTDKYGGTTTTADIIYYDDDDLQDMKKMKPTTTTTYKPEVSIPSGHYELNPHLKKKPEYEKVFNIPTTPNPVFTVNPDVRGEKITVYTINCTNPEIMILTLSEETASGLYDYCDYENVIEFSIADYDGSTYLVKYKNGKDISLIKEFKTEDEALMHIKKHCSCTQSSYYFIVHKYGDNKETIKSKHYGNV